MEAKGFSKDLNLWRFGWNLLLIILVILAVAIAIPAAITENYPLLALAGIILLAAVLEAFLAILFFTFENIKSIRQNGEKLDDAVEMLNRTQNLLAQIAQAVRLSDSAKQIVFSDIDKMELRETILSKLYQHDFESTDAMIDEIDRHPEFSTLADQLRQTSEKYRNATEDGRIGQIVAHIEKLAAQYHWAQATAAAERLVKSFPDSQKAQAMPQRIQELKDQRKTALLSAWDKAVKDKKTDYSLEILKELDHYLTPTEALALQESASTVFRTKLHNLGVQFSVEVAERKWDKAVETGRIIVNEFPNSRMAREIRSKMDILQENARQNKK